MRVRKYYFPLFTLPGTMVFYLLRLDTDHCVTSRLTVWHEIMESDHEMGSKFASVNMPDCALINALDVWESFLKSFSIG